MILVKVHNGSRRVVAICDKELIGRVITEGIFELKISEHFYGGEETSAEEVKKIMVEATNLNIVGKESIKLALEVKVIDKEAVVYVDGIPHAQAITL